MQIEFLEEVILIEVWLVLVEELSESVKVSFSIDANEEFFNKFS